jgi:hypothetical protein
MSVLLTGCRHRDHLASIERMPEAALRYPGATDVVVTSQTPRPLPDGGGRGGAGMYTESRVRASATDIIGFYDRALSARRWVRDLDPPGPGSGGFAEALWHKGDLNFNLTLSHGPNGSTVILAVLAERHG